MQLKGEEQGWGHGSAGGKEAKQAEHIGGTDLRVLSRFEVCVELRGNIVTCMDAFFQGNKDEELFGSLGARASTPAPFNIDGAKGLFNSA